VRLITRSGGRKPSVESELTGVRIPRRAYAHRSARSAELRIGSTDGIEEVDGVRCAVPEKFVQLVEVARGHRGNAIVRESFGQPFRQAGLHFDFEKVTSTPAPASLVLAALGIPMFLLPRLRRRAPLTA